MVLNQNERQLIVICCFLRRERRDAIGGEKGTGGKGTGVFLLTSQPGPGACPPLQLVEFLFPLGDRRRGQLGVVRGTSIRISQESPPQLRDLT
jgi:hypothetical protein